MLIPMDDLPESIRNLVALAVAKLDPERVILFGSRARGTAGPMSDFDLAFDFDPSRSAAWSRFVVDFDDTPITLWPVDLVNLRTANQEMRREIESGGRVLYSR
jgi:predicted nucleotidyltransferase